MYIELIAIRDGIPHTETYRLDSDSYQEIKSVLYGAAYNLCLDAINHRITDERSELKRQIVEAEKTGKKISGEKLKRLAELDERIDRASLWFTSDIVAVVAKHSSDINKIPLWRGKLIDNFNAFEQFAATMQLLNTEKLIDSIHDLDPDPAPAKVELDVTVEAPAVVEPIEELSGEALIQELVSKGMDLADARKASRKLKV
jgi:hypothetical protein